MTEISEQFQISGEFQGNFAISGISGLLGPPVYGAVIIALPL